LHHVRSIIEHIGSIMIRYVQLLTSHDAKLDDTYIALIVKSKIHTVQIMLDETVNCSGTVRARTSIFLSMLSVRLALVVELDPKL
jgi:hypothetical protein